MLCRLIIFSLSEINLRKIEEYRQFFLDEQSMRVDESKRIGGKKGKSSPSGNGLDAVKGSFKKLAID